MIREDSAAQQRQGPVLADVRGLVGQSVRITTAGCKPTIGRIRAVDHRGVTLGTAGTIRFYAWSRIKELRTPREAGT